MRGADVDALHAAGQVLDVLVLQDLRHGDGEREGGERQVVALETQRRQAEQVADDEAARSPRPAASPSRASRAVHQDGGGVAADRQEGAVAQRDLAVEARQQVEAEHGDGKHDRQVELQEAVVADQPGLAADDRAAAPEAAADQPTASRPDRPAQRASRAPRFDIATAVRSVRGRRHGVRPASLLTWPNRPLGFSVSTVMTMTSATVSFSPLPMM